MTWKDKFPKENRYFETENGILYKGDCLEIMKEFPEESVDLVVTDPPYWINYKSFRTKRGNIENDDNLSWSKNFTKLIAKILKKCHHLYCFFDPEFSSEFVLNFRNNNFKIRNFLTIPRAMKGNGGNRIFQQQNEFCLFATYGKKNEGKKFNQTKILKPSKTYLKDKRYNAKEWLYRLPDYWYWTTASVHNSKNKYHPTQKNVKCLEYMVELSSNKNQIVLDPFIWSWTTLIACEKLNRKWIGIELNEEYCEIAKQRILNFNT